MPSANTGSLRDRRRAELLSQIHRTAHQLFAERGFEAVTTEDIAAAAGISISTYFRYAPTKEGLLIAPVREASAESVGLYGARPSDESAVEALIQLAVARAQEISEVEDLDTWRQAVAAAPHLLSQSMLVSESDLLEFIEQVAARMGVDAEVDIRPALLVHTSVATVKFVLDRWLASDVSASPPFHVELEDALRIALAGFD
ncbi:TetR family transcriptional regulator [Mycobacterium shigaense]|uniref:TetR family transcriptional regulator n=1 Tax=Mycobacterium shigaense TaxID=722731 RepID=A0A1Z4EJP9_9MYCO|nr:TetR family transcriptional regulator [Mycobacterium shigaense]MEA1123247.1 TetR family transcriptional regulator [Mycobacterium shigaense]PRI13189.1 TetR family transcriptional regulator [Mycobacterium shigaense]BAX93130.1 TetR family transcriptional regulator [Mycobacterium shigaense]